MVEIVVEVLVVEIVVIVVVVEVVVVEVGSNKIIENLRTSRPP